MKTNQKGFTLVEIAIVLVIIGLLLGGVMKGQELITNAKLKNDTEALQAFQTSYYAYQDRTGKIPGDADNDGKIDTVRSNSTDADTFFQNLAQEGLIKAGTPMPKLGEYFSADGQGATGSTSATNGHGVIPDVNQACITNLKANFARSIDVKLDDGVYNTGTVRANEDYANGNNVKVCLGF